MAFIPIPFVALSTEDQSFESNNIRDTTFEAEVTAFTFSFGQDSNLNNSNGRYTEQLAVEGGARLSSGLPRP